MNSETLSFRRLATATATLPHDMPPSRVSSIHAMDLESGEEFERIKQNFRSTVVEPDVTGVYCFFVRLSTPKAQRLNVEC